MAELSKQEFWVIEVYFEDRGFYGSHRIIDIKLYLSRLSFGNADNIIQSLIEKKVLSPSPDGNMVKFTDYGLELYSSMVKTQHEWEKADVIKVSNIEHDQILIHSGEIFKGNRIIREIFSQAKSELCILDPYVGPVLFDLLEDSHNQGRVRIVTSDKTSKGALKTYEAYRAQYALTEMRFTEYEDIKFHDRFVLWDNSQGFHFGHSLKDLGKKDTQINLIKDPCKQTALFDERWAEARPMSLLEINSKLS